MSKDDTQIVDVWENQRHMAFKGWGQHRLPVDRPSWSNKKGDVTLHMESYLLPLGWQWATPWQVEERGEEGWYYAPDFTIPTRFCSVKPSPLSLVRRRRWIRTRQFGLVPKEELAKLSHSHWSGVSNYGFPGLSEAEAVAEQTRQHLGFASLYHHSVETASQKIPSPTRTGEPGSPVAEDDDDCFREVPLEEWAPRLKTKPAVGQSIYKFGVPNVMRELLWPRWSGAVQLKQMNPDYFTALSNEASLITDGDTYQEIAQDVVRTAPKHPYFEGRGSAGSLRLTNILLALSQHPNAPPYHQAFSYVVATLLLNMGPEDVFWVMVCILDRLLPKGYHENYLLQYDLRIVTELLRECFPELEDTMERHQIDVAVFASGWLQGLFCAHFPFPAACRVLDVMLFEGNSSILVRMVIAFLKIHQSEIMRCDGSGSVGQYANNFARSATSIDDILLAAMNDGLSSRVLSRRAELLNLQAQMNTS